MKDKLYIERLQFISRIGNNSTVNYLTARFEYKMNIARFVLRY